MPMHATVGPSSALSRMERMPCPGATRIALPQTHVEASCESALAVAQMRVALAAAECNVANLRQA